MFVPKNTTSDLSILQCYIPSFLSLFKIQTKIRYDPSSDSQGQKQALEMAMSVLRLCPSLQNVAMNSASLGRAQAVIRMLLVVAFFIPHALV